MADLSSPSAHHAPPSIWQMDRLKEFDLSPHTMVAALSAANRVGLDEYLAHVAPQWPELPAVLGYVATHYPKSLRLKELFETMECFRVVGQFIYERSCDCDCDDQNGGGRKLESILDLACGREFTHSNTMEKQYQINVEMGLGLR